MLICDICRVWWWRIFRHPIVVLTTESGGLGDYLWFRSYYSVIREHYAPAKCRIIVIGMCQWESFALGLDKNGFNISRSFASLDNPLKIESLFFKLFRADIYVDFRAKHLKELVKSQKSYFGLGFRENKQYYETANNSVINQWFSLPKGFKHKPPLLPIDETLHKKKLKQPYVVFVEGGNTQGRLSDNQTLTIIKYIISKGYNVFFNVNYNRFISKYSSYISQYTPHIIDGYTYNLAEYPTIVARCHYVVTVNTFIYHLAIQLEKPCVVISANEYESVKLDAPKQVILFNKELQQSYETRTLHSYHTITTIGLQDIECERIIHSLDLIEEKC